MRINRLQRAFLVLGLFLAMGSGVYPPWESRLALVNGGNVTSPSDHALIFRSRPPEPAGASVRTYHVDLTRLGTYWVVVFLGTSLLVVGAGFLPKRKRGLPPNDAQLESAVPHVVFEKTALDQAIAEFKSTRSRSSLEASLLHARNLRAFLLNKWDPRSPHSHREVLAEHFFPSHGKWRTTRARLPRATLDRTKTPIDTQLAHITIDRADPGLTIDLAADLDRLAEEIESHWTGLIDALDRRWQTAFHDAMGDS